MMAGIPIIPFILVAGLTMIVTMWVLLGLGFFAAFVVLAVGAVALFLMRLVSKHDDQKLNHLLMRLRNRQFRANVSFWNGHSVSPVDYQRRPR